MRYEKGTKGESKFSIQMVLDYIEQNRVTQMKDLPKNLMNYVYREKLSYRLPFKHRKTNDENYGKRFKENRLQDWYAIEKILPFLERWAEEEGTTIEKQCYTYFLLPEWKQYCLEHPEYRGK